MPRLTQTDTWVKEYRELLRQSFAPDAKWFVGNHNGSIRLEVKHNGKKQTRVLPFEWSKKGFSKAIPEIQQIYKRFYTGSSQTLEAACEVVKVSDSNQKIDYSELIKEFRLFVPNASDTTWRKSYLPILTKAKELLARSKGKPQNGEELMMKALEQWEQGTRQRTIQRRSLNKFLSWAVARIKLPAAYAPPPTVPEIKKPKKIGYAFTDQQILALIDDEPNPQWQFAYQLLAVYGLRPEELRYLRIIDGAEGKELWSIYKKSMGGLRGDKTKPRRLEALLVRDADGKEIDWKLQERIEIGEQLPPLGAEGQGGLALRTHIRRRKIYQQIKADALKIGQEAVPYSFRHRYSKESHASGFDVANIAEAMGHTPEVHWQNYSRFKPSGTTEMYRNRNKQTA